METAGKTGKRVLGRLSSMRSLGGMSASSRGSGFPEGRRKANRAFAFPSPAVLGPIVGGQARPRSLFPGKSNVDFRGKPGNAIPLLEYHEHRS